MLEGVFEQLGTDATLPAITLWFADFVDLLIHYWYVPTGIVAAIAFAFVTYINTPRGRYNFDYFKYNIT